LVIPKGMKDVVVASNVCVWTFILHHTLHHTFAFINIHLDIHRIITIITQAVASTIKIRFQQKEKETVFMLRCVRKEGKVFFAFSSKNANFVHNKALYAVMER
jgi:hypothetical protein